MHLILDAEATIGIQSKMSGIDEETLDGNVAKNLIDNVSNDLPHNGGDVLKNISLIGNDKKIELLENLTTSNKSCNTNENSQFTTSKSNRKENEKFFGICGKESIDHQSSINVGKNENAFVDDYIQPDQTQKKIDSPEVNNECSAEEDAINDTNSAEVENVLAEDITEHKEIYNLENEVKHKMDVEQFVGDVIQNDKMCNFENEVENKIDEEAILEDVADNDKMCNFQNEAQNKIDEEAILEDVADNDKMCTSENEAENKIDEEAILEDVANDQMSNFENEAQNKIDEEAILEDVVDNDKTCNFENEAENKIDEEAILEDVADADKMCYSENEVENKIDEEAILEDVANDQMSNFENEAQNKIDEEAILEDVVDNDKTCNFENEAENKIDEEAILEDVADADKMCYSENGVENKIDEEAILNDAENYKICNLENKTDVDAVLDKVVVNDNRSHLEIEAENKMHDEDAILGVVVENDKISNLEIKVNNKIDEDSVLEQIVVNDNTSKVENTYNEDAVLVEVFENDNISNLENDLENKLDESSIFEKNEDRKNEQGCIIENITRDDENVNCLNDDDLNSNGDNEKNIPHNEESLAKDETSMKNLPSDQSAKKNSSHPAEKAEESKFTEKTQEKRERESEPIEIKMPSTDEQTSEKQDDREKEKNVKGKDAKPSKEIKKLLHSKLSNTLNILSDDEDELPDIAKVIENVNKYNHSISLVDDDDVMLIEDDAGENEENITKINENISEVSVQTDIEKQCLQPMDMSEEDMKLETVPEEMSARNELDLLAHYTKTNVPVKPLLSLNVLKSYKKNLADMTREELEEFCISKIVESVVDRSNLGDIKAQLKATARTVDEYKKKLMMISKQTRDFQVILKSVQQEQKKPSAYPITPLKLTRSVGMQVFMTCKPVPKKRQQSLILSNNAPLDKSNRNNTANTKTPKNNQQIPVPRLVPAATPAIKATSIPQVNNAVAAKSPQTNNSLVNGLRNSPPAQKPEKRTRMQSYNTVDLTDDEPPTKIVPKSSPTQPVRLVPPQNLLAPQRQPFPPINSPRKVYIPISSPQTQNIRPGQTYLLKSVPPSPGPRPRAPTNGMPKMQPNSIRMNRPPNYRHPAPLPDAMKQYQPPNWKALPPAPDLKLTKADNGIIISWTIDGYPGDSYEEVSSYQLFAYQESASPPSTALWKKIGDVKALPLPMACTLTQFLAGFKYYFAVRAVDVKSRLGPFSSPGSILLLNEL